jgi:hypothetical protein
VSKGATDDVEMKDASESGKSTPSSKQGNSLQDLVLLNEAFVTNFIRVSLPNPTIEEVYKKERVSEDRTHAIEAQIIRIMKTRKRYEISSLI